MPTLSTPFGRLASIRRRNSKNKPVQPIDVDAAKQYNVAGPLSAASASLLTPRPRHFRSTSPSPATPSAASSSRFVSSPTFVSSSALHAHNLDALTPPLSPVNLSSTVAANVTKSPLRRALSRSFFGSSAGSSSDCSSASAANYISSPIQTSTDDKSNRASRPARPARPSTSPATDLSPNAHVFGSSDSSMTRSQTCCPIIIAPTDRVTTRRCSRTLLPPATVPEHLEMERSASSPWSMSLPRSTSPTAAPASPPTSLRSIRQMHARKSIYSVFESFAPSSCPVTPDWAVLSERASTPPAATKTSSTRRLTRRASEESFQCRGPEFDCPPAADPRTSMIESYALGFYAPRSVSMPSTLASRRMTDLTHSSYQEAKVAMDTEDDLTGLGLVDTLPDAPKVLERRPSTASQLSLPESVTSSESSLSLSSMEQQVQAPWPEADASQNWFSACPPTPPSSIRLELEFQSLPPASGSAEQSAKPTRPLSGIFIPSNSSVLDLKETIASRMRELGYRLSPKNLTLTLHLSQDDMSGSLTALDLKLSAQGKSPAKVLDDSSRLLFEEGAQEDDLVVVDCDPSHTLWNI